MKIKEEKPLNPVGPDLNSNQDLGDGSSSVDHSSSNKGLNDDLMLNGADIKMENPSTPLLDPKTECPDMPPLSDLGHPDFPDCKPPMNPYCYPPHYNNNLPPTSSSMQLHPHGPGPGSHPHVDYGPPPMVNYGPPGGPGGGGGPPTKQQPSTLEAQYMQQQSQIFVFSTKLANKAADAVFQGQFPSIIGFHTSQPATRKFLEKNPFKMNNFGRQFQGSANWPPPPPLPQGPKGKGAKGQQQQQPPPNQMGMPGPPPNMPPDFNSMHPGHPGGPPQWSNSPPQKPNQQGYPNYYDSGPPPPPFCGPGGPNGPPGMGGGPGGGGPMPPGGPLPPGYFPPGAPNNHPGNGPHGPMPTGIKIPDENLTPQQRLHREEQLAKMRTMQKLLFPENDHPHTPGDPNCHPPMPPHENMNQYDIPGGPPGPGNDWPGAPNNNFFVDGQPPPPQMNKSGGPLPHGPQSGGNGPRKGGGSIPSPATPLTPSSSCGAHHRPSPHSPMPNDPFQQGGGSGGHSFYPTGGYYSPQVGQVQDNSPSAAVQRKDSESSNSEGGKSRKDKSSCSISPTSSAPPSVKEANLMPVPSPQQIQYLNVFEGQELTIQKQPNVGLSEHTNDHSPGLPPNLDMNPSTPNVNQQQKPSHSAPPTPVSMASLPNQKLSSEMSLPVNNQGGPKGRPGSVGPVVTPKNSTTPLASPQAPDRNLSQPGTPQMNLDGMKGSGNNFGMTGPGSVPGPGMEYCPKGNMLKQGMQLERLEPHPDGPGSGVFDNVPLNPNLSGPAPPGSKPAFDPISSMVQMSQQLTGGNGTPPNPTGNGMGGNGYGGPPQMNPNMVNFNTSMHSVQNVDGCIAMGGPQTVNNTYVNATMTIQQMNIQNIPPYMSSGPNMGMGHQMGMGQNYGPMGPGGPSGHSMHGSPMNSGGGPPQNQMPPQMGGHPGGPGQIMHGNPGNSCGGPPPQQMPTQMGGHPGVPGQMMHGMPMNSGGGPSPMGGNPGGPGGQMMHGSPMNSGGGPPQQHMLQQNQMPPHLTNHPGGPGQMMHGMPMNSGGGPPQQQMPPMGSMPPQLGGPGQMGPGPGQMGMCGGGRPPPHPTMYGNHRMGQNSRSSPYRIPNSNNPPRAFGGTNIQVKPSAPNTIQYLPARPPPPMCSQSGVMSPQPGPRSGPNLEFLQRYTNPTGPVNVNVNMGMNVNVNMSNRYPGPPGPSGPGMGNGPPCGIMRGQHPHNMMMDHQGGPPPGAPVNSSGQSLPPAMMSGPNMKGPGPGGPPGPPPSSSDPAYAQQFHHFQQQLYATGTNNIRNPMQNPNVQTNNPNTPPNQTFFK